MHSVDQQSDGPAREPDKEGRVFLMCPPTTNQTKMSNFGSTIEAYDFVSSYDKRISHDIDNRMFFNLHNQSNENVNLKRRPEQIKDEHLRKKRQDSHHRHSTDFPASHQPSGVDENIIRRLRAIFDSPGYKLPTVGDNAGVQIAPEIQLQFRQYLDLTYVEKDRVVVYVRGLCHPSAADGQSVAGIGVFWGDHCFLNTSERYGGIQDGNHADIAAVMRALETAQRAGMRRLHLRTASGYRDMSLTGYLAAWPDSQWDEIDVEEVKCRPLLLRLEDLIRASRLDLTWEYVTKDDLDPIGGHKEALSLASEGARLPSRWLS